MKGLWANTQELTSPFPLPSSNCRFKTFVYVTKSFMVELLYRYRTAHFKILQSNKTKQTQIPFLVSISFYGKFLTTKNCFSFIKKHALTEAPHTFYIAVTYERSYVKCGFMWIPHEKLNFLNEKINFWSGFRCFSFGVFRCWFEHLILLIFAMDFLFMKSVWAFHWQSVMHGFRIWFIIWTAVLRVWFIIWSF